MTIQEIRNWLDARIEEKQRRNFSSYGRTDETRVHFDGGDDFRQVITQADMNHSHTDIYINGDMVYSANYIYRDFKWEVVA